MDRISKKQVENSERFYRVPKALFEDEQYSQMKPESKLAYAILKDRFELSLKNGWIDDVGDVYLIYKNSALQRMLSVGEKKLIAIKKELNAFGLLEEERQGLNRPNLLYIGNLNVEKGVIHRVEPLGNKELSKRQYQNCQNGSTGTVKITGQELSKRQSSDTEFSDTDLNETKNNSLDDDDKYIGETENQNQISMPVNDLLTTGNLLVQYPQLRNLVHKLISDLLVTDTVQSAIVVKSLVDSLGFLKDELRSGNTILQNQIRIHGEVRLISILEENAKKQLAYMNENLIDHQQFGRYFAKGLAARLRTAVTTNKYAMGY
ncbi:MULTISPECIES: replication initiator protein A [Leuconostoc]|uniref:replication initiator protein A n=1 Tax=Leuconostoc TaxID=1243 RepID=UPI0002466113|nr:MULTISPECIES: replication initiator protein A [Leuconostoc]MBA5937996.1 replication initiator protein A [Leuconostoc citreum]MDV8932851.1 replication initiator protein A [Leuconostoc citreum]QOG10702.1 replication initiator protein A [Leuconostoc sp. LN180020]CCF25168.1 Replication initiator protein A [Leuconostoc citreum LBAE C10]CCF27407.1 Replication initiator protein A [Leuconostoc citreum LBAE C11]